MLQPAPALPLFSRSTAGELGHVLSSPPALDLPCVAKHRHVFCEECIRMAIRAQKRCPTCRKNLTVRQLHRIYLE